jgi:hypothetical protein
MGPDRLAGVELSVTKGGDQALLVAVNYRFLQVNGEPEEGTTMELYSSGNAASDEKDPAWKLIYQGPTHPPVALPRGFGGNLQAFVTPRTSHKAGRRYHSQILQVKDRKSGSTRFVGK